jgi:hypothetical protein
MCASPAARLTLLHMPLPQVLPLGFVSRRIYHDVLHHPGRCEYVCEIGEEGALPTFSITHTRDASIVFRGRTAVEAWSALVSRRHRLLHTRPPPLTPERMALEAAIFFGFGVPAVAQLIEQLVGATRCEGFCPRYALPERRQRDPPPPRSISGCARTDPIVRRSSAYKFAHQKYYRGFINRGELAQKYYQENFEPGEMPQKVTETAEDVAVASAKAAEERSHLGLRKRDPNESKSVWQIERSSTEKVIAALKMPQPVRVGRSAIHNWGLFTTRSVPKDGVVVEYMGLALRNSIADHKEKVYEGGAFKGQGGDCYMFRLDGECVLDATMSGNVARFINHCCTPNCYSKVIVEPDAEPYVDGSVRGHIVIFAMRDLEADEEVTYDYKFPVEAAKIVCGCGSPRCLGFMN